MASLLNSRGIASLSKAFLLQSAPLLIWLACCRLTPKRPLAERLQMALGVARGMAALEENDPPIVHRDLKPTNVFIDAGELHDCARVTHSLGNCHLVNTWCPTHHCSGVVVKVQCGSRLHTCHSRATCNGVERVAVAEKLPQCRVHTDTLRFLLLLK